MDSYEDKYHEMLEKYDRLICSIRDIMDESEGVTGLHRNGEVATWGWLIDNDWLPEEVRL